MRKHMAFFRLIAKSVLPVFAACLVIMTAVEVFLFWHTAGRMDFEKRMLTDLIDESHISFVFIAAVFALYLLLCLSQDSFAGRQDYTLRRLTLRGRSIFFWQFLFSVFCYFILWAVQAWVAFFLCRWFLHETDAAWINGQTLMLTFYQNEFLHHTMPLSDTMGWFREIMVFLSIAASAAVIRYNIMMRRNHRGKEETPCENI